VIGLRAALGIIAVWLVMAGTAAAQFRGRVVMSGAERSDVLVSLQTLNGQIVHQAFTSSRGDFLLEGAGVSSANPMFVVVDEEGYKVFRYRLREFDLRGGTPFTIYLEPEDIEVTSTGGAEGLLIADVRQLQAQIPAAALRDYGDAMEESADGNYDRAVELLERAIELAPDYYDAWIGLGGQYDRLGRYEDAKAAYLEASEVNPAGTLGLLNLGALYYQQGERERAEEDLQALGTFYLAEEWLRKAVDINPASAEARFYLGAALYRMDLFTEAEEELQNAIALDEDNADVRLLLINVYTRQSRYPEALEQAAAFLENNPGAPERATIERVRSQIEDALGR
jgi:tetratricopeptide (TPR) repeat protein